MVEPPRGMFPGRLDEKGRLKLPAAFQQYFNALREKQFFVTSLDRRIVRIYPMDAWRRNEDFFESFRDDPKTAKRVAFNAADLGAEADMDNQGRITIHPELRRELGMENAPVRLFADRKSTRLNSSHSQISYAVFCLKKKKKKKKNKIKYKNNYKQKNEE